MGDVSMTWESCCHEFKAGGGPAEPLSRKVAMCGNSVTDPLGAILSLGTPVSLVAVSGLVVLSWHGFASRWSVVSAAVLAVGCTAGLVAFGRSFFQNALPGFHLSDTVWWLRPFGI